MVQRQISLFLFLVTLCLGVWSYIFSVNEDFSGGRLLPWTLTRYGDYMIYATVFLGLLFLISLLISEKERVTTLVVKEG